MKTILAVAALTVALAAPALAQDKPAATPPQRLRNEKERELVSLR